MLLAIISDTHDNLAILEKAAEWMNKNGIKQIIHCGDICAEQTLKDLSQLFKGKIHVVFGNVDGDVFAVAHNRFATTNKTGLKDYYKKKTPNVTLYGEIGELKINDLKIAFVHQPKIARALALSGKYNLVFYGHTHKPWEEKVRDCRLINPGNLSNMLYKATFAVYDTKTGKLELKILEKL
jgi:hypothetical protein